MLISTTKTVSFATELLCLSPTLKKSPSRAVPLTLTRSSKPSEHRDQIPGLRWEEPSCNRGFMVFRATISVGNQSLLNACIWMVPSFIGQHLLIWWTTENSLARLWKILLQPRSVQLNRSKSGSIRGEKNSKEFLPFLLLRSHSSVNRHLFSVTADFNLPSTVRLAGGLFPNPALKQFFLTVYF